MLHLDEADDVEGTAEAVTTIKSVERAATLLGLFSPSRPRITLSELTARLGVSKATAHRYSVALRRASLLRYDKETATYTVGPRALTLGAAARAGLPIISLAAPIMDQLVRGIDETVVLSVWDGEGPVVVHVQDNTERIVRVSVALGARLGMVDSAQGRVFCAFLPTEEVPGLEKKLRRSPELREELDEIRTQHVATNSPEVHGVRTVAAPVIADGRIAAVIAIVGTAVSISGDVDAPTTVALCQAATQLSRLLGEQ